MDNPCPKCGFANPRGTNVCRCGYENAAGGNLAYDAGPAQTIRTIRLVIGLSVGVLLGMVLLLWELLGSNLTVWGIIHPILLIASCAGLLIAGYKWGWFSSP